MPKLGSGCCFAIPGVPSSRERLMQSSERPICAGETGGGVFEPTHNESDDKISLTLLVRLGHVAYSGSSPMVRAFFERLSSVSSFEPSSTKAPV